jgi:AraC family transcriptional regulator
MNQTSKITKFVLMAIVLESGQFFGEEKQVNKDDSFKMNITHYDPLVRIQRHYHENAYLSLLISGKYSEKNSAQQMQLQAGEVIFRPAGYEHANDFPVEGGNCLNIEIKKEVVDQFDLANHLPQEMKVYAVGELAWLYQVFYEFKCGQRPDFLEEHLVNWLSQKVQFKTPSRLPWLSSLKSILESEYDGNHTIPSLAKRVFVHPIYLARAFKEKTGLTIGNYQSKVRMRKATALIFKTDKTISDIALTTGFSDSAHLVRSFRQFYKTSPARFRQQLKS